jgi:hypothetical protein
MSNLSPRQLPSLEVKIMFEPHRLQHGLLRQAYACLIQESRRSLSSGKALSEVRCVQSTERPERRKA